LGSPWRSGWCSGHSGCIGPGVLVCGVSRGMCACGVHQRCGGGSWWDCRGGCPCCAVCVADGRPHSTLDSSCVAFTQMGARRKAQAPLQAGLPLVLHCTKLHLPPVGSTLLHLWCATLCSVQPYQSGAAGCACCWHRPALQQHAPLPPGDVVGGSPCGHVGVGRRSLAPPAAAAATSKQAVNRQHPP
jgi:hypothetical protein